MNIQRYDLAVPELKKTIELDNKYINAYLDLGAIYEYQKDYKSALDNYLKAYSLDRKNVFAIERIDRLNNKYKKSNK